MDDRDHLQGEVVAFASEVLNGMTTGESMETALDELIEWFAEIPAPAEVPREQVKERVRDEMALALRRTGRHPSDRPEQDVAELDADERDRIIESAITELFGPDPLIGLSSRASPYQRRSSTARNPARAERGEPFGLRADMAPVAANAGRFGRNNTTLRRIRNVLTGAGDPNLRRLPLCLAGHPLPPAPLSRTWTKGRCITARPGHQARGSALRSAPPPRAISGPGLPTPDHEFDQGSP